MGAIFFYIFVYFVGYYGSNILNMLTVKPLVTNRFMAALLPVYGIAMMHAYMITIKPLPAGSDITIEYALLVFVALPVVVVTLGATYLMWNSKGKHEGLTDSSPSDHDTEPVEATATEAGDLKTEPSSGHTESADEKSVNKEIDISKSKDNKET